MPLIDYLKTLFKPAVKTPDRAELAIASIIEPFRVQAEVDGVPIYELATLYKHDLTTILRCCGAEEAHYWAQPESMHLAPSPYYFERAAILSRELKDYAGEVDICRRWIALEDVFMAKRKAIIERGGDLGSPDVVLSVLSRARAIRDRLPKAEKLLRKQEAISLE
ncbi:hypothetical protein [Azotobacter chroococcum]|uniref:hypothetical protein n=1 Tax=Azotobacter chroococcum TaxID=353 RepID=UPI0010AEA998|nr:hypothetical protein [Azotobacter chroococcum]TKD32593.1 hypothetical protein FCG41_21935 [Azotobacter chroococcum]